MIRELIATCVVVGYLAAPAGAQPPAAAPPIEPDRPDVTNGARIVDSGLVQIELGGLYARSGSNETSFGSPLTARIGLTNWLEGRIGTDGLLTESTGGARATGLGNVQLGAKIRLWAKPSGAPALSLLPTVNLPIADSSNGLGSGDADYTIALLTGRDIGARSHVDVNYGIGAIGAGSGQPHFLQHLVSVSLGLSASARWSPYIEGFWFSRQSVDGASVTALDGGVLYIISPRFVLDGGLQVGASADTPDVAFFGGLSVVIGDIFGGRGVQRPQHDARPRRSPVRGGRR